MKDFRAMGKSVLLGVFDKLNDYFGGISQSEVFQNEIPFTDGKKLGEVLNLREAFDTKIASKARESAKNTAGQAIETAKGIANDVRDVAFKNVQDLASRIGNKLGFKNDDFNGDGTNDPRLEFEIDFNHVAKLPDTSLNFNVELGELGKFGIEKSNLGLSAQVDAQFDFLVLLQLPGQEDGDKLADKQADGSIVFRNSRPLTMLNGGGELLTTAGTDIKITLSDGTTFDIELDEVIRPITTNIKAKVVDDANANLSNIIEFTGTPNLTGVQPGMVLSIINRVDGKVRTDRFSIDDLQIANENIVEQRFAVERRSARFPPLIATSNVVSVIGTTLIVPVVPVATKSFAATPVTGSLKVAKKTTVSALFALLAGALRVNDNATGGELSSKYVSSVTGSLIETTLPARSVIVGANAKFNPTEPFRLAKSPLEMVTSYVFAVSS